MFPNNRLCRRTIINALLSCNLPCRVAIRKPLLNKKQRAARLQWANRLCHWDLQKWKRVCFSDESIFRCFSNSNTVKVRRRSTEGYLPECLSSTVKHGPQIHVWGIIGPYGPGPLKVVHGNLNSINYQQNIINDIDQVCNAMVFPLERAIFMQDKAPAHWSASTRVFLANRNLPLLPWPGNSPDCNPIENVWYFIGSRLRDLNLTNSKDLWKEVQRIWYNLSPGYLHNLYKSMARRVKLVKKNRGGPTKY